MNQILYFKLMGTSDPMVAKGLNLNIDDEFLLQSIPLILNKTGHGITDIANA